MTHRPTDINNLEQLVVKIKANPFSKEIHAATRLIYESLTPNTEISNQANLLIHAAEHRQYVNSRVEIQKKKDLESEIKNTKILIVRLLNEGTSK